VTFSARARINLNAIQHNLNVICSIEPAARVMAVVKGNAYGHGMLETATALADVDAFAVARISEAAQLRDAGCEHPLVLLGGIVAESDLDLAAGLGVSLCVHNHEQIEWLENFACGAFEVWLKIDTGMHRLGFHTNVAEMAIARLNSCSAVKKLSLMTHLANADNLNDEITDRQMEQFSTLANDFKGDISIANSGGLFGAARSLQRFSNASREGRVWMRPGIALFGVSPIEGSLGTELGLKPAMNFESTLIAIRAIRAGQPVGYGGEWQAPCDTKIGVIAVGYGDGYACYMQAGAPMSINNREVRVVGAVSMDLTTVDLGPNAQDDIGDRVLLWGDALPVERVAEAVRTAAYQLITGITHREAAVFDE